MPTIRAGVTYGLDRGSQIYAEKLPTYSHGHCAGCGGEGEWLDHGGADDAEFRYYRCPACGCVWTEVYGLVAVYIQKAGAPAKEGTDGDDQ